MNDSGPKDSSFRGNIIYMDPIVISRDIGESIHILLRDGAKCAWA
jgi:hypothetical protein